MTYWRKEACCYSATLIIRTPLAMMPTWGHWISEIVNCRCTRTARVMVLGLCVCVCVLCVCLSVCLCLQLFWHYRLHGPLWAIPAASEQPNKKVIFPQRLHSGDMAWKQAKSQYANWATAYLNQLLPVQCTMEAWSYSRNEYRVQHCSTRYLLVQLACV